MRVAGLMCNGLRFTCSTSSSALVGYLFSSFGRVLDLKSRGPRFNSCLGWIVNFYISSLSCYTIMEIFVQVLFFNYCKVLLSPKYHPFSLLFEQFDFWSAKKMLGPESLSKVGIYCLKPQVALSVQFCILVSRYKS